MKYLLKKIRFLEKYDNSPKVYIQATKSYFRYLLGLDFMGNQSLLKYFGHDFFHDAIISAVKFDVLKREITLNIIRLEADGQDINNFRKTKGLAPISDIDFIRKPIQYECNFYHTRGINGTFIYPFLQWNTKASKHANFSRPVCPEITIMDTEIEYLKGKKCFKLTFSTSDQTEFCFTFSRSKVKVLSKSIIQYYTAGKKSIVPHCEGCTYRLLDKGKMRYLIKQGKFL